MHPSNLLGESAITRSVSTTTLTSVETEGEPTYAVLLTSSNSESGPLQLPAPPPVPPKSGVISGDLFERVDQTLSDAPPAVAASPHPPFIEEVC